MARVNWLDVDASLLATVMAAVSSAGGILSGMYGGQGHYFKVRVWMPQGTREWTADSPEKITEVIYEILNKYS